MIRRPILATNYSSDVVVGDFVRAAGIRGVALVENVHATHATIAYSRDNRYVLPLVVLRRVKECGAGFDCR